MVRSTTVPVVHTNVGGADGAVYHTACGSHKCVGGQMVRSTTVPAVHTNVGQCVS